MYYIWIHRVLKNVGDMKVPFTSIQKALEFGKQFINAQKNYYYDPTPFDQNNFDETEEYFMGGCEYTQVAIITDTYRPENCWRFWASHYFQVTEAEALSLGGCEKPANYVEDDPWEKN
jgi:hypothetical protein